MKTSLDETVLQVKNLSIGIREGGKILSSVEDVSFDIKPGEILGIVGESGSGKTLTALSIAGLLGAGGNAAGNKIVSGGKIVFGGRDLLAASEKELNAIRGKEISMIFQEPFSSLNPLMKVGDQIAETLEIHGEKNKAAIKSRVRELLQKLNLSEPDKIARTYPHRLSGGMCQRVMIALAVIRRPKLLIADEPTTALDNDTQDQILNLLKEINRDMGTSILFISHDLEVIKKLSRRLIVMYAGRVLEEGYTDEVFRDPRHEYTRGLLHSIPDRSKKGYPLSAIPGRIPSLEEGRPRGCPFHPRCGKALDECESDFPTQRNISLTHKSRCVLASLSSSIKRELEGE